MPEDSLHPRQYPILYLKAIVLVLAWFSLFVPHSNAGSATPTQPRIALVIANSEYRGAIGRLSRPKEDGDEVSKALKAVGFSVTRKEDLSQQEMQLAIQQFKARLLSEGKGAVGFFYYAGHGGAGNKKGEGNYLVPVDADLNGAGQFSVRITENWIKGELAFVRDPAAIVVVIDACRLLGKQADPGPLNRAASPQAFDPMADIIISEPAHNFLLAYSTSQGRAAADSGQYAEALAKRLREPGLTIPQVFEKVRYDVSSLSRQMPVEQSKLGSPLCLAGCQADMSGPYTEDSELYRLKRNDAISAMDKIGALQAESRCSKGWEKVLRLRDDAQKLDTERKLNSAAKLWEELEGNAVGIETYLRTLDATNTSIEQLKKLQADQHGQMRQQLKETARREYGHWRDNFNDMVHSLKTLEPKLNRSIQWEEIRRLEKECDGYVSSGNYEDALNSAIEGFNVANSTIARLGGRPQRTPIQKREKVDEIIKRMYPSSPVPDVPGWMPNGAGC